MRVLCGLVVAVLVVAVAAPTTGSSRYHPTQASPRGDYLMLGSGAADCGQLTSNLRRSRELWATHYTSYTVGFLTGANYHAHISKQGNVGVGENTSVEAMLAALEQYCAAHPLDKVSTALEDLYRQLESR
jgi:hypothetical protein